MKMRLDEQEREDVVVIPAQPGYSCCAVHEGEGFETGAIIAWVIDGNGCVTPITDVDGIERASNTMQITFIKDPSGRCWVPYTTGYISFEEAVCGKLT